MSENPSPQSLLSLDHGCIHLWCVFSEDVHDESLLTRYRALLAEEERQKEKRFYFLRDQRRYLITRALVRSVLSRYAPLTPEQWSFFANSSGKPSIANEDETARRISFNVSHTSGLIILAVTCDHAIGVDTENLSDRSAPLEIARQYFTADEVTSLYALPKQLQKRRFFQHWTLKESYVKARGTGLSTPLNQFGFHFPRDQHIEVLFEPLLSDLPYRWHFWQFQPSADFLVAICVEHSAGVHQKLIVKRIVPLGEDEIISCGPIWESTRFGLVQTSVSDQN